MGYESRISGSKKAGDEISVNSSHGTGGLERTIMDARNSAHAYTILLEMHDRRSDGSMIGSDRERETVPISADWAQFVPIWLGAGSTGMAGARGARAEARALSRL